MPWSGLEEVATAEETGELGTGDGVLEEIIFTAVECRKIKKTESRRRSDRQRALTYLKWLLEIILHYVPKWILEIINQCKIIFKCTLPLVGGYRLMKPCFLFHVVT